MSVGWCLPFLSERVFLNEMVLPPVLFVVFFWDDTNTHGLSEFLMNGAVLCPSGGNSHLAYGVRLRRIE